MNPTFTLTLIALGPTAVFTLLFYAARQPLAPRWRDQDDVRGIIMHTVRAPTAPGRKTLWESRYAFYREHSTGYETIKPYNFKKPPAIPLDKPRKR